MRPAAARMSALIRVLVVEDDEDDFFLIQRMLESSDHGGQEKYIYEAVQAASYQKALETMRRNEHEVCLLDYRLPGGKSGLDFLREAKSNEMNVPIIFLTGIGDDEVDTAAMKLGASDFLRKNKIDPEVLSRSIRYAVERQKHELLLIKHEERIRQSEKMEAIGNLAAGVAHDFNNLLNVINGNADLLLMDSEPGKGPEELEEIKKAVQRGSEMTRQLLLFSRKEVSQSTLVNLNRVVDEVAKMLRRMIREDVEIELKSDPELRSMKADSLHLQQILMNLTVNARDAMPQGGKLVIETKNMDLEENFTGRNTDIPPGRYVVLSVSDTGVGMDEALQERIFEPFFTTKEPGKGTGLGLATVYGVVKKYGGHIWVYSEKGMGTTFHICFAAEQTTADAHQPAVVSELATGTETILVVEDEPSLRRVIVKTLQKNGYRVFEAENGADGLAKMWESWRDVELLLTDSVMPKMSGKKLADEVKKLNVNVKVLFISGYPRDVLSNQGILDPDIQLLQKPFSGEMLLKKVREVLDEPMGEKTAD